MHSATETLNRIKNLIPLHHNFLLSYTVKKTATLNMVYDTKPPYDEQSVDITVTEVSCVHPGEYDSTKPRKSDEATTRAANSNAPLKPFCP